ncbi:MAG TPA: hypothetical protein VFH51_11450, partial [Myxococcota bacterium]|nr:hypothetical protein [Myxococcota bacterium]
VQRRESGGGALVDIATLAPTGAGAIPTTFTDHGAFPGKRYEYLVAALNPSGVPSTAAQAEAITSHSPTLAWTGPAALDVNCTLTIAGSAAFDTAHGAVLAEALAEIPRASALTADTAGASGVLTDKSAGDFNSTWTVFDNLGGTTTLTRPLRLSHAVTHMLPPAPAAPTLGYGNDADPGRQPWYRPDPPPSAAVCSTCTGLRSTVSLQGASACMLTVDGQARCWGNNTRNQLGDGLGGDGAFRTTSAYVCAFGSGPDCPHGSTREYLRGLRGIALGGAHACATTSGAYHVLLCWGDNTHGQLGVGTSGGTPALFPATVCEAVPSGPCGSYLYDMASVSSGARHTCGLSVTGDIWCWGFNGGGAVGNGTTVS